MLALMVNLAVPATTLPQFVDVARGHPPTALGTLLRELDHRTADGRLITRVCQHL